MSAPRPELARALAVLAEPWAEEHAGVAGALGLPAPPPPGAGHASTLRRLHPWASVYLSERGMMGGAPLDRIAGFWRAVGRTPPPEADHLARLLGLYADLVAGEDEEAAEARERAARALVHEHLAPWLHPFVDAVRRGGGAFDVAWADLVAAWLAEAGPPAGEMDVPVHLAVAPGLPDPRPEEGVDFLEALLAPARSGLVVTGADLAGLARELGLGLRIGERRYVLRHLMDQDAPAVLQRLSAEAAAAGERYRGWAGAPDAVRTFWVGRAERSAELLVSLADEARRVDALAGGGGA